MKISFTIESGAAIKDVAVAFLRSDAISFDSEPERDAEIIKAEGSVAEAIQTLIDSGSVLSSIPGAEEQGASFQVLEVDALDNETGSY